MQNYHRHTSYSNLYTPFKDSLVSHDDYAKRAKDLGHSILSSVEHGYQGNWMRCWETAKKYELKFVYGTEAYFVADRTQPDPRNAHLVLLARNYDGIRQINHVLSEANRTGFYKVPRLDIDLVRQLSPENVFSTTACVAHWGRVSKETGQLEMAPDAMRTFNALYEHLGSSLRLEVQAHDTAWQKEVNALCQKLSQKYGIPLIAGLDSHYIFPEQFDERRYLREESGIHMKDEDHEIDSNVYEDYPDDETVLQRFRKQGILTEAEIAAAMNESNVILEFEDIEIDRSRKLPVAPMFQHLSQEQRNELYLQKVEEGWHEYRRHVPEERWPEYESALKEETDVVTSTNTSDYFLIDHEMVKLGKQYGGYVTPTGRGSGGSFLTNTMLGFSTLDRLALPVKLYPERFVTADRLISSLPDLDLNVANAEPFARAQEDIMGAGHSYPMLAFGTLKVKSAFKLFARAKGVHPDIANDISKQLTRFELDVKHAEDDDKDLIDIADYVSAEYLPYIEGSKPYQGIVVSKSQAPCGYLISNVDIESEIGLIRVTNAKKQSVMCTVIDGYTAEAFGYVKNDILTVNVIDVNVKAMNMAELPHYTSREIIQMTAGDRATWDIFSKGYTAGINQCQGDSTTQKLTVYKPRALEDLAAFVAAIRPGFKSQIKLFLNRQPFSYNVPPFDDILKNDSTRSSWMLYQENTMQALNMAGFSMQRTYPIIKAISKKKVETINAAKEEFLTGFSSYIVANVPGTTQEKAHDQASQAWKVIEDSSSYSFNASHAVAVALDALYGAYLKAHHPLPYYCALLNNYSAKGDTEKVAHIKAEMKKAFGIKVAGCRFREDNRSFSFNVDNKTITDALQSVKTISKRVADALYSMRGDEYATFVDFLVAATARPEFNKTNLEVLIRMDYFAEFGSAGKLLDIYNEFRDGKSCYKSTYVEKTKLKRLADLYAYEKNAPERSLSAMEQIKFEAEYYGAPISVIQTAEMKGKYSVVDVNAKYGSPKLTLYSIYTGNTSIVKIRKSEYELLPVSIGQIIQPGSWRKSPAKQYVDGKPVKIPGKEDLWFYDYEIA